MSIQELKKAVLLKPDDAQARFELAEAFFQEDKPSEARKQLTKLLELDPGHENGLRLKARIDGDKGKVDTSDPWEAALKYAKAYRLHDAVLWGWSGAGDDAKRWAQLAEWCEQWRMNERARLAWGKALGITQGDPKLAAERDRLLHKLGEDDSSDLISEAPLGALHDAVTLLVDGDVLGAKRVLATASDKVKESPVFHRIRAEIWRSEGEDERAKKALAKAAELDPRPYRAGRVAKLIDGRVPGRIGVLAWTEVGGAVSILEALAVVGEGKLQFTGNVKEHIKESCAVAYTCLKHAAPKLGIDGLILGMDLHLHFTDIETSKEGFSAGLALTLAGLSALRQQPLYPRLATTGAITLHGDVQRIDGIHEKFTAAKLLGMRRILYPRGNSADVKALPPIVTEGLELFAVSSLGEALEHAF